MGLGMEGSAVWGKGAGAPAAVALEAAAAARVVGKGEGKAAETVVEGVEMEATEEAGGELVDWAAETAEGNWAVVRGAVVAVARAATVVGHPEGLVVAMATVIRARAVAKARVMAVTVAVKVEAARTATEAVAASPVVAAATAAHAVAAGSVLATAAEARAVERAVRMEGEAVVAPMAVPEAEGTTRRALGIYDLLWRSQRRRVRNGAHKTSTCREETGTDDKGIWPEGEAQRWSSNRIT